MSAIIAMASACLVLAGHAPVLGISGPSFMLDGQPTFLLGISYYGALGIEDTKCAGKDMEKLSKCGFNWIRVWATWNFDDCDVSAVAPDGAIRQPYMKRLEDLCRKAGQRGMVVDVTVTRGEGPCFPSTLPEHKTVMTTLAERLKPFRNVYFDVGNERNIGDQRHVPMDEVGELISTVKRIDARRLCTASQGGDISAGEVAAYLTVGKIDFLCPHRPRNDDTPGSTEYKTREYLEAMKSAPRVLPINYQEPFRRDYAEWMPLASDFAKDLKAARDGGAAGWCFHNGASRRSGDKRPRRSFDMRPAEGGLFGQFDAEERAFLDLLRSQRP